MGRGLSDLQQWILREARQRGRLYHADIYEGYYGWKPRRGASLPGEQRFSKWEIGEAEYNKTMATVSRSCTRLEARGLVTCLVAARSRWSAVEPCESQEGTPTPEES
jgi:hypothetical protein